MLAALGHRGRDAVGVAAFESSAFRGVALGARFDWLAPEQVQAPPLAASPSGRYTVAADARLDDRDALARTLGVSTATPDSALIALALDRWGRDAPSRLTGDFAFATWDATEQVLFCARDPMGVRPFYYALLPGRWFAFASAQRPLVALPGFPADLDRHHLADYLLTTLDHASTFYRHLRRLPAATSMTVGRDGVRRHASYWRLDAAAEVRLPSEAAYAEAFHDVFERAVRDRMRGHAPVGAALSGGLDSSSIAVVAAQHRAAPLPVFSAQFPDVPGAVRPLIDERPYVEAVARTGRFDVHVVEGHPEGPFFDYERVSAHLEDAFRTGNLYMHWQLFGAAQQAGVRVFLDGLDGDTAVSHGDARLFELARNGGWAALAHEVQQLSGSPAHLRALVRHYALPPLAAHLRAGRAGRALRGLAELRRRLHLPARRLARGLRGALHPYRAEVRDARLRDAFILPSFARETDAWARHVAYDRAAYGPTATEREAHIRDVRAPLCPLMLEMEDRTAAAFGIEPRYPFFDTRLLTFCIALPPDQKLRDGLTRRILRTAMQGRLPDSVRLRTTKGNLKPALDLALARMAEREIAPYLFETTPLVAEFVDLAALRQAYARFVAAPLDAGSHSEALVAIVNLERGLRRLGLR